MLQPFSIVEDAGFRRLAAKAEPCYKLPSRKYFASTLTPDMHKAIQDKVCDLVSAQSDLGLTSDVWSDPSIGIALLSLTAHWVTEDFQWKQMILAATPLEESHTGEYLACKLTQLCDKNNIPKANIHLLVHDEDANMHG